MKISYDWLGDFVDLKGVTTKQAAELLTRLGIEVESLAVVDLSGIIIFKVLAHKPHPKTPPPVNHGRRGRLDPARLNGPHGRRARARRRPGPDHEGRLHARLHRQGRARRP